MEQNVHLSSVSVESLTFIERKANSVAWPFSRPLSSTAEVQKPSSLQEMSVFHGAIELKVTKAGAEKAKFGGHQVLRGRGR